MTGSDQNELEAQGDREAEGSGETVGEAKWTALRQLEQRFPGLDKAQVEFVVISEGERGLLGVGFAPAKVIARASGDLERRRPPAEARRPPAQRSDEPLSASGERLQELLEHVRDALELDASVSVQEIGGDLVGMFHGRELGLVIGKHGQTIDAVQFLASAAVQHLAGENRLNVVVDAAGYRDRRRATLEAIADRAAARAVASGSPVELEPMSPAERKIVHLYLKERAGVVTGSEGFEPNRYVTVRPDR